MAPDVNMFFNAEAAEVIIGIRRSDFSRELSMFATKVAPTTNRKISVFSAPSALHPIYFELPRMLDLERSNQVESSLNYRVGYWHNLRFCGDRTVASKYNCRRRCKPCRVCYHSYNFLFLHGVLLGA